MNRAKDAVSSSKSSGAALRTVRNIACSCLTVFSAHRSRPKADDSFCYVFKETKKETTDAQDHSA